MDDKKFKEIKKDGKIKFILAEAIKYILIFSSGMLLFDLFGLSGIPKELVVQVGSALIVAIPAGFIMSWMNWKKYEKKYKEK